jgi:hypothetical protein
VQCSHRQMKLNGGGGAKRAKQKQNEEKKVRYRC